MDRTNFGQDSIICDQIPPCKDSSQPASTLSISVSLISLLEQGARYQILGELYSSIKAYFMSFDTSLMVQQSIYGLLGQYYVASSVY